MKIQMNERLTTVELKTNTSPLNSQTVKLPYVVILVGGGAILSIAPPVYEGVTYRIKGVFLKKAPKIAEYKNFINYAINNDDIFEVIIPYTSIKRIINIAYKK